MSKEINSEWVLRDELFISLHRWYLIVFFVLVGAGVALGVSYLFPTEYQASVELAVDLNPYRALDDRYVSAFAHFEFRNVDDYKHWQMSQLNLLVYSDEFLQATLDSLRIKDPYWNSIQVTDLRKKVKAQWRNAGVWLLSAQALSPQLAGDAVSSWRDVILEKTSEAIENSQRLFQLELELRALNVLKFNLQNRQTRLIGVKNALATIQSDWSQLSPGDSVGLRERWRLAELVAQAADFDPVWAEALDDLPGHDDGIEDYLDWIERVSFLLEDEISLLDREVRVFSEDLAEVNTSWTRMLESARGLSATLSVDSLSQETLQIRPVRSEATLLLVGGISGLLLWALFLTYQITRRVNERSR